MFEGPVTAHMEKDGMAIFTCGHFKGSISTLFSIRDTPFFKSRFKNITKVIDGTENFSNFILGNHKRKVG